jgi:hypothetical protein
MPYETKDVVALVMAAVGAVLGILNSWRMFDRDRVRIKVVPRKYVTSNGDRGLCVDVINLGYVAVTVTQLVIDLRKQRGHMFWFTPGFYESAKLPYRLEPRASITVYVSPAAAQNPEIREGRRVIAKTACGRIFYGQSPAFRSYIKDIRTAG